MTGISASAYSFMIRQRLDKRSAKLFLRTQVKPQKGDPVRSRWEQRARDILRHEMTSRGIRFADLADLLTQAGLPETDQNLRNKVGRGSFTAAFFLQALDVMGSKQLKD